MILRLLLVLLFGAAASSLAAAPERPFSLASGRVTYRLESPLMSGTSTLAWIEHGRRFRQDVSGRLSLGEKPVRLDSWTLSDGKHVYHSQPGPAKTAFRMRQGDPAAQAPGSVVAAIAAAPQGKRLGRETVAGKPCEIRAFSGGKIWLWNSVPLKLEYGAPGGGFNLLLTATRVETGVKVPAARFRVPAGYQVRDWKPPSAAPAPRPPHPPR